MVNRQSWSLIDLKTQFSPVPRSKSFSRNDKNKQVPSHELITADQLDPPPSEQLRRLIESPRGEDRSKDLLACMHEMHRCGYPEDVMMGVGMNPSNAVHAHVADQSNQERAVWRAIQQSRPSRPEMSFATPAVLPPGAIPVTEATLSSAEVSRVVGPVAPQAPQTALPLIYFNEIQPRLSNLWLIKGFLPLEGLALIYGHPGSGKSFLAIDIALNVAGGRDWFDRRVKQGTVIYVAAEGAAGLQNRIVAFQQHHGIDDLPFAIVPCPIDLQGPGADTNRLIEAIKEVAAKYDMEPVLIVIDTISKTFGAGKENTDDMASYVANCGKVSAEFGCCVMPVHHRPKDTDSIEPRGHGSLKGGVDTVILVESGEPRRARVTKQKDGETGVPIIFRLVPIFIGLDDDGQAVNSCVIEQVERATVADVSPIQSAMREAKLSAGVKLALNQLDEVTACHGIDPPDDLPHVELDRSIVTRVVMLAEWREKAIMAAGTDAGRKRDSGKRAFNRAQKHLQTCGFIRVWGDYVWREPTCIGTGAGQAFSRNRDDGTSGTHPFRGVPVSRPQSDHQSVGEGDD